MNSALIIVAILLTVMVYTARMKGLFLRCPHCGKIVPWRYDTSEPPDEERDEDGVVQKRAQIRVCRNVESGSWISGWTTRAAHLRRRADDASSQQTGFELLNPRVQSIAFACCRRSPGLATNRESGARRQCAV